MRRALLVASVTAMTLAVTSVAGAQATPEASAAAPAEPPPAGIRSTTEPSLPLRPPVPLELAKPAPSTSWGTRLGLVLLLGLGAFAYVRTRRTRPGARATAPAITVHAKTSLGLRTDVAIVEAAGLRLLVGITPSSVQTLAVLSSADDEEAEALAAEMAPPASARFAPADPARLGLAAPLASQLESPSPSLAARARSLFEGGDARIAKAALSMTTASKYASNASVRPPPAPPVASEPPAETKPAKARRPRKAAPVEGQARGLVLALASSASKPAR